MKVVAMKKDISCRICSSTEIEVVFQLAPTPPEDQFVTEEYVNIEQKTYPLDLALCQSCGYLHLPDLLSPELSYQNYTYETSITLGLSSHYQEYASDIITFFDDGTIALVVDLGSNDGSMLKAFQDNDCKVVGVEPATAIANKACQNGIPTINNFFCENTQKHIVENHGHASIVTANYMFANIDNVIDFTNNAQNLLADDGIFVVLTGYHPDQMTINMFDYIYHEHFSYFTIEVLQTLFSQCGLQIIDAQKVNAKGGSIRVIAQKTGGKRDISAHFKEMLLQERQLKMKEALTYIKFADTINHWKNELQLLCDKWKKQGKKIVGYGASHSTTTLVYHFELNDYLAYQVDDNPVKHGLYSPGHHIPVFSSDKINLDKPDVIIILAWNYAAPIINKNQQYLKNGGIIVCPLPELKVITQ